MRPAGPHRAARLLPRRRHRPGAARSASPGSACARACSCCSSSPLGVPTAGRPSPSASCSTCSTCCVSLLGAPAFAVGGAGGRRREPPTRLPRRPADRRPGRRTMPADDRASGRRRPGCGGGARSLYVVAFYVVYSSVRNQFGSAGRRPAVHRLRPRQGHHRHPGRAAASASSPRLQQWYLDLPGHGVHPVLEHLLRHGPLRRHARRAGAGCSAASPTATRLLAQHAGAHDRRSRSIGFASFSLMPPRLLDDTGAVRRLPRTPGATDCHGVRRRCDTLAESTAGWVVRQRGAMAEVSNQYAAMPSMHIGWSTWCALVLLPMVRRRWAKVARRRLPGAHPVLHHGHRQPLLDRRASAASSCLGGRLPHRLAPASRSSAGPRARRRRAPPRRAGTDRLAA